MPPMHGPVRNARINRTGDHTPESRLWMVGPGVAAGGPVQHGNVLDIAPTVLDLLGVSPGEGLDGRPLRRRLPDSAPQTSRA